MKTQTAKINISKSNDFKEQAFTIKASSHAFSVLSEGLYSDKITAIIRELSCNAYDSHVAAGWPTKPFDVHAPNTLEPHFSIRDYGTGLSEKEVMKLYTTYFESTKQNSNDFVGALGLGSKSPFSYTDSFQVTSWFNGKVTHYTAYLTEARTPSIARLTSPESTDQPNGVEVKFGVKPNDFYEFKNRFRSVYKWFTTKPNFGGDSISIPTIDYTYNGDRWGLTNEQQCVAIQGNIAYPIDMGKLGVNDKDFLNSLDNAGCVINFDIGDLEVAASREHLRYDDRTKANILKRLKSIEQIIFSDIEDWLVNLPTNYQRLNKLVFVSTDTLPLARIFRRNFMEAMENGKTSGYKAFKNPKKIGEIHKWLDGGRWRQVHINKFDAIDFRGNHFNRNKIDYRDIYKYDAKGVIVRDKNQQPILDHVDALASFNLDAQEANFWINDVKRGGITRIDGSNRHTLKKAIIFHPKDPEADLQLFNTQVQELLDILGNPPVTNSSTLAEPVREVREKAEYYYYSSSVGEWIKVHAGSSMDATRQVLYVINDGTRLTDSLGEISIPFGDLKEIVSDIKLDPEKYLICRFPIKRAKQLAEDMSAKPFFEFVKQWLIDQTQDLAVATYLAEQSLDRELADLNQKFIGQTHNGVNVYNIREGLKKLQSTLDANHNANAIANILVSPHAGKNFTRLERVAEKMGISLVDARYKVVDLIYKLFDTYPMLYCYMKAPTSPSYAIQYIKEVDERNAA